MNLILIKRTDIIIDGDELFVEITDNTTICHLKNILRVTEGKTLKIGVINSIQDCGSVHKITKNSIILKLSDKFKSNPTTMEISPIDLVVGIPRPKSLDKLLQYSSSMGVGNIDLICSSRVEKSYLISHKLTEECIEQSLLLGLQQGVHTIMPKVEIFQSLGEYERKFMDRKYGLKLIAHPYSIETLGSLKINTHVKGPILVAIGPEGGWLNHELEYYNKLGFVQFKLTDRILRTEVATVAILSQLTLLLNDSTLRNGLAPAVR